uniref:NADH-ubiquinone oxidoreductase chain 6 n=1 Tax=Solenocera crassicornis TaxID=228863 RepID=A0A172W6M1_9EUCA|nr:NADH dehydrogenase subunit 6 [Solenocera crassicornis]YP_010580177.1 NADH dehydrogenase subunit 6 [Solenocera melantho]ANF05081.1 NADH dehydrogenase subunit 6 [Solenocera crassicornis]AXJ93132.1 NADH dehydrogenase subunit 6 [Solenocera crassicornis]UZS90561.1 NADH dehydrogenase subunit 6 [Solenocera melantho]
MSLIITLLPIISVSAFMFTRLLHPLAMGLSLLTQTLMICLTAGLFNKSFWFSYILFIIFLGAMLVLFIYVASLASNETFKFSSTFLFLVMMTSSLSLILLFMDPLTLNLPINISQSSLQMNTCSPTPSLLSIIYNNTTMNLTLFIVLYLLLTLIVVVKITNTFFGPLRLLL